MSDEDPFRPLSAKVQRKKFSVGGNEIAGGSARASEANRLVAAMKRRQADREARAARVKK